MIMSCKLVTKLATKLSPIPVSITWQVYRYASRGAQGWLPKNLSDSLLKQKQEAILDNDHDMDAVEAQLDSIVDEVKRRRKTVKFHMIKKKLNDPGPPERRLTWDAIEQIRNLKQEYSEEWTIQELADGFSVSPDVISRVLSSKFNPPASRKQKQDVKVSLSIGHKCLGEGKTDRSNLQRIPTEAPVESLSSGKPGAQKLKQDNGISLHNGQKCLEESKTDRFSLQTITTKAQFKSLSSGKPGARKLKQDNGISLSIGPNCLGKGKTDPYSLHRSTTQGKSLSSGKPGAWKLKQEKRISLRIGENCFGKGKTDPSSLQRTPASVENLSAARGVENELVVSAGHCTPSTPSARQKVRSALLTEPESEPGTDTCLNPSDDMEPEEEWDGEIWTEEELESFAQTLTDKPSPVQQKGRDFFDVDGNFLYRI